MLIVPCVLILFQYARDKDGVKYPLAHDFYRHSNTHDPDQDGFEDLYHQDFIHAISRVARRKLAHHCLCQGHSTLMLPVHYSMPSQGQLVQLVVLTR